MLVSLEIRNFLLIKKLSINLIKGFNTFTGETGAGKSIIIDALKLALGGKNNSNHNLKDNEITTIKAVFEINQKIKNKDIKICLNCGNSKIDSHEYGISCEDCGILLWRV